METLVIIVAVWLILLGIYGALPMLRGSNNPRPVAPRVAVRSFAQVEVPAFIETTSEHAAPIVQPRPAVRASHAQSPLPAMGLFSEVDMLRAQVEHLRSELSALATAPVRREAGSRSRRYRPGVYTELPRSLRRQVHEVRSGRRHF